MEDKKQVGVKLTKEARELRELLAKRLGVDKTAVVEIAIRRLAQSEGVSVDPKDE